MSQSVVCLISTELQADRIAVALRDAGFPQSCISVLLPDKRTNEGVGFEKHSKAPEGTATGAGAGALLGGALGWLAGIGTLTIPGAGPFIAAGPLMSAMSGAAIGTSVGGIAGGLIGLGIPEYEAKQYADKVQAGNVLISAHADNSDMAKRAEAIFKENNGKDINRISEEKVKT
jgi:hypothetical protein